MKKVSTRGTTPPPVNVNREALTDRYQGRGIPEKSLQKSRYRTGGIWLHSRKILRLPLRRKKSWRHGGRPIMRRCRKSRNHRRSGRFSSVTPHRKQSSEFYREIPGGCVSDRDELSGWFNSFDQYRSGRSGTDGDFWKESYNGGKYKNIRKTDNARTIVRRCSVSICGGIQPDVFRRTIGSPSSTADGMSARFYCCDVPTKACRIDGPEVPEDVNTDMKNLFRELRSLEFGDPEECTPVPIPMTPTAVELHQAYHSLTESVRLRERNPMHKLYIGKSDGRTLRPALVFQMV